MSSSRRGIVLVFTLFLVLVVALIGRALVQLGPGSLALTNSEVIKSAARRATESGIEYAITRLRQDPEWKGDGGVTVDSPSLYVVEDAGNVIGLLTAADGKKVQFRFRFNYQDGSGGGDSLDDPNPSHRIDNIYVSKNNLPELAETVVPRADQGSWAVSAPDLGQVVPARTACIIVEGRAGPALENLSSTNVNPSLAGRHDTLVAEVYLAVKAKRSLGEASLMGGGDIDVTVRASEAMSVTSGRGGVPRLRSKKNVLVADTAGGVGRLSMREVSSNA